MCARFTLAVPNFAELAALLKIELDVAPQIAALYRPRYNIAPAQVHLVLRAREGRREIVPAAWGFASRWARPGAGPERLVNARAESARTKPTFREAFAARRCVVPADGFYEWTGAKGSRKPIWFYPQRGGLLHLAGLHEPAKNPAAGPSDWAFTILTTDANADISPVHDRMPAILDPADVDLWLTGDGAAGAERAEALLRPAPSGALGARAVSPRVNSVAHDDPSLLREVSPGAGDNLSLFDTGRKPPR